MFKNKVVWIIIAIVAILFFWVKGVYNNMVTQDEGVKTAWSQVENQYQRRMDLIPNLVNTVKGYAAHEKETLEGVVNARAEATKTTIDPSNLTEESLKKLKTDYVDLLLIHQPFGDYYGTYRAMEEAYKAGKARAIGVSNFYPDRYIDIAHFAEVVPAVNQVETHVFQQQKVAREYLAKHNTQIMSWGPFAEGKNDFFNTPVLKEIGAKYGKSVAQVALRFLLQNGVVVIPKSTHEERMQENFNVFDFVLTDEEMKQIEVLDTGKSLFFSHYSPETVEWFMSIV